MDALYQLGVGDKGARRAHYDDNDVSAAADATPGSGGAHDYDRAVVETTRNTGAAVAPAYGGHAEASGAFHSFLEHSATYIFFPLFAAALYLSVSPLAAHGRLWLVGVAFALGLIAGDFISGLVHWLADTYGNERTPLVGANFIKWFRLHHVRPKDICAHNFIATNGNTCIIAAPLVALCLSLVWRADVSATRAFIVLVVVLMTGATVATNQFHKWAHEDEPSRVARWLQSARLVLPPAHHLQHHAEPFNAHYCITNGWLNPLLERIKFFARLELALGKLGMKRDASAN